MSFTPETDLESQKFEKIVRSRGWRQNAIDLFRFLSARIKEIKIAEVASTMSLATFLGIVPLLAIILAIFAVFPQFAETRQALEDVIWRMLPDQHSEVIITYIKTFSSKAAGLTTFGLIGLFVSICLLLNRLFTTLNQIFRVKKPRPIWQRVLIFWALITIGPIALALSITMTGQMAKTALAGIDSGYTNILYTIGEIALQCLAFTLTYMLIPKCRIRFKHALIGALIVTTIGQTVKTFFGMYVTSGSLTNIYGAFTAIPVLILWIYVSWYLFFVGAAVTATIPLLMAHRFDDELRAGNDFLTAMHLIGIFTKMRREGVNPVMGLFDLSQKSGTYPEFAKSVLKRLETLGMVAEIHNENHDQWALIADIERTTAMPIFNEFAINSTNGLLLKGNDDLTFFWNRLITAEALKLPLSQCFDTK